MSGLHEREKAQDRMHRSGRAAGFAEFGSVEAGVDGTLFGQVRAEVRSEVRTETAAGAHTEVRSEVHSQKHTEARVLLRASAAVACVA